ncbi:MAG: nuclear transport factor 2 family protein [Cyclobacteriaceae bacterium]
MKKIIFILALTSLVPPAISQDDISSLKDTYAKWIEAWNDGDSKAVAKISWGNYGFGRDVPFLRSGTTDSVSYEQGIQRYMNSMLSIDYKAHQTNFRIIDGIGFVDGFYEQTTQQTNGPLRSVYGRQSLVFLKQGGNWKMKHYHRSALPNEFTR